MSSYQFLRKYGNYLHLDQTFDIPDQFSYENERQIGFSNRHLNTSRRNPLSESDEKAVEREKPRNESTQILDETRKTQLSLQNAKIYDIRKKKEKKKKKNKQ